MQKKSELPFRKPAMASLCGSRKKRNNENYRKITSMYTYGCSKIGALTTTTLSRMFNCI
jgi:hypothetical protein